MLESICLSPKRLQIPTLNDCFFAVDTRKATAVCLFLVVLRQVALLGPIHAAISRAVSRKSRGALLMASTVLHGCGEVVHLHSF